MGILQKSSLRLTFGFTLALAIGVLLNVGLSTTSWAASSYTRVNNQTVKFSVTADVPGQSLVPTTYFVADGLVMGDAKFWAIKESSNSASYCQLWIDMSQNGANRWTRNSIARVSGKCADKTDTYNISVNDSGASIFFSQAANGVIGPALKASSAFEFKRVSKTTMLDLTTGLNIYIQTSPTAGITCPRLLVQYASNRWGFIAPLDTGQPQTNYSSTYYQQVLLNYGITNGGNCNANDDTNVHRSSEQALAQLIGGSTSDWGTDSGLKLKFISFKDMILSVKQMSNAVGDPSAAEIRLKTTPAGSIDGSLADVNTVGGTSPPKTTCAIDGIGWIICPVMNFMGKVVDGSYGVVDGLLKTPFMNTDTSDPANGTYQAWAIMRNIANVAFVIAFLIIIFSQITSVGITNYGVKKMLPRLIIAAILVNVSYFVCVIAVDISNILGSSMKQVFDNIGHDLKISTTEATFPGAFTTGTGWQGIVGFLLAGTIGTTIVLYAGMSVLLPALIAAVLAIVTVFLVLTMRQALLIILIVISPLAFVAYLLPNTEEWFKKWRKLFQSLLLMYPVIAVLFGGSALASQVITASDKTSFAVQVMGALVAILPLFLTVTIMKGASSMFGKVGGFVSSNGMVNKAKKGAEGYRTNRQEYRKLKSMNGERSLPGTGWAAKRRTSREAVLSNRKSELNRANAAFVADRVQTDEGFKAQLAAGGGNGADMRALAGAISVKVELSAKEVKAASAVIEDMNLDSKQLGELAAGGVGKSADGRTLNGADDAVRKAAIMGAVSIGTVGDVEEIIKSSGTMSQEQRKILSSSIASSGITNKATHLAGQTLDDIAQGNVTSEDDLNFVTARAIEGGKYSSDKIGDNDHASLKRVVDVLGQARSDISTESRDSVGVQTTLAMTDNRKGRLTKAQMPYLDVLKR